MKGEGVAILLRKYNQRDHMNFFDLSTSFALVKLLLPMTLLMMPFVFCLAF